MLLRLPRHRRRHLAPAACQSRGRSRPRARRPPRRRAHRLPPRPRRPPGRRGRRARLLCRDARLAYQIHAQACRRGLAASNPVLACSLLAFYSAARSDLPAAARLFDEMPRRDAVAYTAMMSAFIRAGDWAQALALYPRMPEHTLANLLALCASRRLCCHGRQLHAQLLRWGADLNLVLKTALLHTYSSCG
ncbi:hypothetical protein CFC21_100938, partial [Triticum aestivum]